jgi:hypothetical protein
MGDFPVYYKNLGANVKYVEINGKHELPSMSENKIIQTLPPNLKPFALSLLKPTPQS